MSNIPINTSVFWTSTLMYTIISVIKIITNY